MEEVDKLLILDLDETLLHATTQKIDIAEDFRFEDYYVYKRPHLDQFLTAISKHFAVGIWSSADDGYVAEIVKKIKPEMLELVIQWGRSRCSQKRDFILDEYYFEKRVYKLKKKGFSLEKIIVVDDTPQKLRCNYGNAIYIQPFLGNQADEELIHLYDYLLTLKHTDNIRAIEKRMWRL